MTGHDHNRLTPPALPPGSPLAHGTTCAHDTTCTHGSPRRKPRGAWTCHSANGRPSRASPTRSPRAFTVVELLVVVSIILVLMTLIGGAVAGARNAAKRNATIAAIERLDAVLMTQFRRYASRSVRPEDLPAEISNKSAARAWYIRRNLITGDMVDRWTDVAYMASNSAQFQSPCQRAYCASYNAAVAASMTPTAQYGGAECLFMIITQGGFADCLDCESLKQLRKGDKDNDGMFEFWDGWDEPIGYILWPAAYEKKGGGRFFTDSNALDANPFPSSGPIRPALGMRPLIYSAGPDKEYGLERNGEAATLSAGSGPVGRDCGNHLVEPASKAAGPTTEAGNKRDDNITNLDMETT